MMKVNPFAVMREQFDGTGLVFDPDSNKVMTLNAAGVVLWKAFAEGVDEAEAAARLCAAFRGVSAEQAAADVRRFAVELSARSLLSEA